MSATLLNAPQFLCCEPYVATFSATPLGKEWVPYLWSRITHVVVYMVVWFESWPIERLIESIDLIYMPSKVHHTRLQWVHGGDKGLDCYACMRGCLQLNFHSLGDKWSHIHSLVIWLPIFATLELPNVFLKSILSCIGRFGWRTSSPINMVTIRV